MRFAGAPRLPTAMPPIAANLQRIRQRIAVAAQRAARDPAEVSLVAVSKTHGFEFVQAAIAAGQCDFGENRPEEAHAKFIAAASPVIPPPRLHLIGPIQSRKADLAVACRPALIHSLDRIKIARKLSDLAQAQGLALDILFEVNIAGEAAKSGFSPDELVAALPELLALPGLRSHGLMTIPPLDPDPETARPHFRKLRLLRDDLAARFPQADWLQLSMGMSDDFEIAIAEGATLVRIGSAIFGPRE
jgi:hypothetical protein